MSDAHDHGHSPDHDPDHSHGPDHGHDAAHGHGHANDQGIRGALRYLRFARHLWRSEINDAVVGIVAPQAGERVLDIGAGVGAGTMVAARSGATVVAVEPTPTLRHVLASRRWLQRARRDITVVDASAEALGVADGSVDAIWAVNTMHHWIDPEAGAREIARALRPGGRVVLVDEDFQDPTHPEHERFGQAGHGFTMVGARQMGDLLTATGLVDVEAANRSIVGRPSIVISARAAD